MDDSAARPGTARRWRHVPPAIVGVGLLCLGWTLVARASAIRMYLVPSTSMGPTIRPGDRVAVELDRGSRPRRGEIWLFRMPRTPLAPPGQAVKRAVGLPGETIAVEGGRVWIDGRAIDEPYLAAPMTYTMPPRRLGPDDYFLLGDSRDASADSHVWGPVPADCLMGRVLYRVWPLDRAGGL